MDRSAWTRQGILVQNDGMGWMAKLCSERGKSSWMMNIAEIEDDNDRTKKICIMHRK